MAVIKCKMCGGDIEFTPGDTYGTCEYCGSTSTIPRAEDEQKLNRYNRANHFRRQCEFDKALSAYEKILEQDDTDPEAHWGAVLSRYGIEYVEDPATGRRIPTCHRVQIASILADGDYQAAVDNAPDFESRRLYEEQAAEIAEIQKGILAISANETPYDVFICYKETDSTGRRTRDSQWAQDVYYGLTDAGYKVFFSRITLEDKLGQQYEPYIFAALNSAKVMVVIGSKPEYFTAVWVKNEWSRYLSLMAKDRKRLLIPCYRDMDPYDLPEELSVLQSQDMSKIGFMQDLLRGVKKVLEADKTPTETRVVRETVPASASAAVSPGVASLMERTGLFLEDGDFQSAAEYIDRVLDIDPKYAPAYAAKVCVALRLSKEEALGETTFLYDDNNDWKKALRFAGPAQKAIYEGYLAKVQQRVNLQIRNYAYDCALELATEPNAKRAELDKELEFYRSTCLSSEGKRASGGRRVNSIRNEEQFRRAVSTDEPGNVKEEAYKEAARMLDLIQDAEATTAAQQCRFLAEQARQKKIYQEAKDIAGSASAKSLDTAAERFLTIPDYKDAVQRAQSCRQQAEAVREGLYKKAKQAMEEAGDSRLLWKDALDKLAIPALDGYKDVPQLRKQAEERIQQCKQAEQEAARQARELLARQEAERDRKKKITTIIVAAVVAVAIAAFFLITPVILPAVNYNKAESLRAEGQYEEAIAAFTELGEYKDAETQITETRYQQGKALTSEKKYSEAVSIFEGLTGYKDVDKLLKEDDNLAAAAAAVALEEKFSVGNYVTFGTYPQTKSGNDNTPIEWLVLARDGNKALLLSKYGLDCQPYNTKYESVTWEECTLRTWLNGTFYNKAFTSEEQKGIVATNVSNASSQGYSGWNTNGGNDTQDKIFLLSYKEANQYLGVTYDNSSNTKARVSPTEYAIAQGAWTSSSNKTSEGKAAGYWWLRSPGGLRNYAAYVSTDGSLYNSDVSYGNLCVRPALWVNLESGIF